MAAPSCRPRNRVNPGVTGSDGAFSWDVVEGYYKVLASAEGCDDGSTDVLAIPPEALGLVITLRCGLPAAPGDPTAAAGDASATVSWTAPSDVGAAVTGYTVTAMPGGRTCTTAGLSCTVTGLSNGTSHTFSVTAENAAAAAQHPVRRMPWCRSVSPAHPVPRRPRPRTLPWR